MMSRMMKVGSMRLGNSGIGDALNTEAGSNLPPLPISLRPGSVIRVPRVKFGYAGPVGVSLALGVAWKPFVSVLGVDFNNGDNIAMDDESNFFRGISSPFTMTAPAANIDRAFQPVDAPRLVVPDKRVYALIGGSTGQFIDKVDTWIWLVNITAVEAAIGRALTPVDFQRNRILTNEDFLVPLADAGGAGVDTDSDVLDII